MSRQQFTSRNDKGQILTFQKSGSTASFDPSIEFSSGSKRVSWRLNNGVTTTQIAGNSLSYTGFTSDTNIRTVQMKGNSFKNITLFNFQNKNLYGEINLSNLKELEPYIPVGGTYITLQNNLNLTGITNPISTKTIWGYDVSITGLYNLDLTPFSGGLIKNLNTYNCPNLSGITLGQNLSITESFAGFNSNLIGNLDLTPLSGLGGSFQVQNNPNLTGITNPSSSSQIFTNYLANNCNLTGNLNLPLSGLGGGFQVYNNTGLTSVTHVSSSQIFSLYAANNCNLTGNLNLPFSGLGGQFFVNNNPNLTGITHVPSPNNFTLYYANNCNLTGNLNLPLSGLGGDFWVQSNSGLTSVTHVPSSQIFTNYLANNCNLTGNLNLPLSGLGVSFQVGNNPNLTGITHVTSSQNFLTYGAHNCNLTGTLDLSPLTNLGYNPIDDTFGVITLHDNPNLTNIIFPNSTQSFRNAGTNSDAFSIYFCDLGYVDFKPLSGATLVSGATAGIPRITLQDNNMTAAHVNHILVDFSGNATYNPTGWSNVNLNIGGTNASPDPTSGGYDGLAAISFLTGSPYNWTITY
jgi:hypothetical protein